MANSFNESDQNNNAANDAYNVQYPGAPQSYGVPYPGAPPQPNPSLNPEVYGNYQQPYPGSPVVNQQTYAGAPQTNQQPYAGAPQQPYQSFNSEGSDTYQQPYAGAPQTSQQPYPGAPVSYQQQYQEVPTSYPGTDNQPYNNSMPRQESFFGAQEIPYQGANQGSYTGSFQPDASQSYSAPNQDPNGVPYPGAPKDYYNNPNTNYSDAQSIPNTGSSQSTPNHSSRKKAATQNKQKNGGKIAGVIIGFCIIVGAIAFIADSNKFMSFFNGLFDNDSSPSATTPSGPDSSNGTTSSTQKASSEYSVTIDSVQLINSSSPTISVVYTFTNNSDEAAALGYVAETKVFQNGVQLTETMESIDQMNEMYADVKPGVSFQIHMYYSLRDYSPITIECIETHFFKDDVILAEGTYSFNS